MTQITRSMLEDLDARDPLAYFKDKFDLPDGVIYFDGNSLGALPKATTVRLEKVVAREWGEGLIRSWNDADWIGAPQRIGDKIAGLVGAEAGEVIVADSTSVNIFKLVLAALSLNPDRGTIIAERGNFPTDHYILQGIESLLPDRIKVVALERNEIEAAVDHDTLLVALTHVHYRTGEMFDMDALTGMAHDRGAMVLWDLCHSAGAVCVDLAKAQADFAVGCGYKFLNGGPGAPSFAYVARRHQAGAVQPLTGWFGHADPFDFAEEFTPASGIERFQVGTPAMLSLAALEEGVDVFASVDMADVEAKSLKMSSLFVDLIGQHCPGAGFELVLPLAKRRGSQVAFRHEHGYPIMRALIERGVIGDFRAPDVMRFGFAPLYIGFADLWDAAVILGDIMKTGIWQEPDYSIRLGVT